MPITGAVGITKPLIELLNNSNKDSLYFVKLTDQILTKVDNNLFGIQCRTIAIL